MFYKSSSHNQGEDPTHKQNHKTENYARADVFSQKCFLAELSVLLERQI